MEVINEEGMKVMGRNEFGIRGQETGIGRQGSGVRDQGSGIRD